MFFYFIIISLPNKPIKKSKTIQSDDKKQKLNEKKRRRRVNV